MSALTFTPPPAKTAAPPMNLEVNGLMQPVRARRLDALLAELDYRGEWLGTAVNGELVGRAERAACVLRDGDRVEILSPMQGG